MTASNMQQQAEETPKAKPVETITLPTQWGRIDVSIWENQGGKDGQNLSYSVTIQRSWFDGEEKKWKRGKSLFPADLLIAAEGLRQAFVLIANQQSKK